MGGPLRPHIIGTPRTLTERGGTEMARRRPPRRVTYFEPVLPRLARNTIIESTFEVGRRFRCNARRLWPARPWRGDPARTRRMAPAHPPAPRRKGACGLARRPKYGLSARRTGRSARASQSPTHNSRSGRAKTAKSASASLSSLMMNCSWQSPLEGDSRRY